MTLGTARTKVLAGFGLALLLTSQASAQDCMDGIITWLNGGFLRYDPTLADPGYATGPLNDLGVNPGPGWNPVYPNLDWQPDPTSIASGAVDDVSIVVQQNSDPCNGCGATLDIEQLCYRGAIDPNGVDWTAGWTVTGENTSIKPAGWETRPIKILSGIQPVSNIVFDADTVYAFVGKVTIPDGATLTIQAGTLCVGENASNGYLTIDRGAQIFANGTAQNPIIMTTDLEPPIVGGWGGLVIHGRAVANCADCLGGASCIAEGNAGDFCGTDDCDNSGSMEYVIVGYAGVDIGVDNELNAFTFNGVGAGTHLRYLQAHQGKDDCFEWFGGKVTLRYAVATGGGDDCYDWQMGFRGAIQNVVAQRYPNQAGADKCIEADNNEFGFDAVCRSNPVVANATFLGSNGAGLDTYGVHFRRGTDFQFFNSIIAFSNNEAVRISDDATVARGLNPFPGVGCNTAAPEVGAHDRIAVSTFPNPVVARTQFSFSMPEAGHAALDIFDVSGRRVASVVNASLSAGPHSIDWTPENGLVGGTYFYRLDAAGAPTTGKLVLVR